MRRSLSINTNPRCFPGGITRNKNLSADGRAAFVSSSHVRDVPEMAHRSHGRGKRANSDRGVGGIEPDTAGRCAIELCDILCIDLMILENNVALSKNTSGQIQRISRTFASGWPGVFATRHYPSKEEQKIENLAIYRLMTRTPLPGSTTLTSSPGPWR